MKKKAVISSGMLKITLGPLDSDLARVLAERQNISIADLVSKLLREEAVVVLAGWREESLQIQGKTDTDDHDHH